MLTMLMERRWCAWILCCLVLISGCNDSTDEDADTRMDTDSAVRFDENIDTDDDPVRGTDPGSDAHRDTDFDTDFDVDSDLDIDSDLDTDFDVDSDFDSDSGPDGFDHVIITTADMRDAQTDYSLRDLVRHRNAENLRSLIVTVDEIYAEQDGVDNAEKIRNFIRDAHENWGTAYFLLGGKSSIVPSRFLYHEWGETESDYYYTALDGTFFNDQTSRWGDHPHPQVPTAPTVAVGRVPVVEPEQMANFVYKVIMYETSPLEAAWHRRAAIWTTDEGGVGQFVTTGQHPDWNHLFHAPGVTVEQVNNVNSHAWALPRMTSGEYGYFLSGGHGWEDNSSLLTSADMDGLTNGDNFFFYTSISCFSGKYNVANSFSERLLAANRNGGAFAAMLNSETGVPGEIVDIQGSMFREYFQGGHHRLGPLLNAMRRDLASGRLHEHQRFGHPTVRWTIYGYTLFGDPATRWRIAPESGRYHWVFSGRDAGWTTLHNMTVLSLENAYHLQITAADPQMLSPAGLNMAAVDGGFVHVLMRNRTMDAEAQLFWTTLDSPGMSEDKSVRFSILPDSDIEHYVIPVYENAGWTGIIDRLRLDPVHSATSGSVEIHRIEVQNTGM